MHNNPAMECNKSWQHVMGSSTHKDCVFYAQLHDHGLEASGLTSKLRINSKLHSPTHISTH